MTASGWGSPPQSEPRPRTPVADLFEETFRLYGRNFFLLVGSFGVFQLPIILASVPVTVWQLQWAQRPFDEPFRFAPDTVTAPPPQLLGALLLGTLLLVIAVLVLGAFGSAAVSYIVARARAGDDPPAREVFLALRRMAAAILGYAGLWFVGSFVAILGLVTAILILATIGVILGRGSAGGAGVFALLLICGVVAAIVVGLAVSIRLSLSVPALVVERQRPLDAFRRSWDLVRGSTWRTFGVVLLTGVIIGLVTGLVSPVLIPGVMEGLLSGSPATVLAVGVVSGLTQLLVGPVLPIVVTLLYFDYARPS